MGIDLTVVSVFGLFGLTGIVVNDSIILVHRYQYLLDQGQSRFTAIVEAACQRLRPVLLTSLTTIAALTPLIFERKESAVPIIPLPVTIAFGLLYASVLILVMLPCLLMIYEGAKGRLKHLI